MPACAGMTMERGSGSEQRCYSHFFHLKSM
jgi:hypothetical protein